MLQALAVSPAALDAGFSSPSEQTPVSPHHVRQAAVDLVARNQLTQAFALADKYVHAHLQEGFMGADMQSKGLSPKWNNLLFGPNDGGRDSFRNLSEHLSARAAAGSFRSQHEVPP